MLKDGCFSFSHFLRRIEDTFIYLHCIVIRYHVEATPRVCIARRTTRCIHALELENNEHPLGLFIWLSFGIRMGIGLLFDSTHAIK